MKSLREVLIESLTNEAVSANDKAKIKKGLADILLADGDEKNLKKLDQYMDILGIAKDGAHWRLSTPRYKATYEYVKEVDGGTLNGGTTYVYLWQTTFMGNQIATYAPDPGKEEHKKWIKKLEDALSLKPGKTTKNYIYYNVNPYELD